MPKIYFFSAAESEQILFGVQLGETSRASRGKNKLVKTPSSPCVLPILEGGKSQSDELKHEIMVSGGQSDILDRDKTFLTGMNDFIPDDILNSLTQQPIPPSREQLGPPTKHKRLKPLEVGVIVMKSE